ncbi:conserved hypothetical protein [Ricinus communis]|uniref:Putative auto-transporter adhesin head GIN domain-containing protein n=1 Tax=Ricinus communis TaxID=3988 RepID=B9T9L0_RICCO|nr:conserved hypothetical protein [Ricinus communis]
MRFDSASKVGPRLRGDDVFRARFTPSPCIPLRFSCVLSQTGTPLAGSRIRCAHRHHSRIRENIMTNQKTRRFLIAACALACIAIAPQAEAGDWPWSRSEQVQGSGRVQSQARDVAHFSGLAMSLPGNVDIRSGSGREGVTVEADDNLLPLIETVVEDGTLKIRAKRNTNLRTRNLKVVVQARDIDRLALGGSGNIDADVVRGSRPETRNTMPRWSRQDKVRIYSGYIAKNFRMVEVD